MANSLIDVLKQYFSNAISGKLGRVIGLTDEQSQAAIAALLPAILAGLADQAATPAGADELNQELDRAEFSGDLLEVLPDLLDADRRDEAEGLSQLGGELSDSLLGDKPKSICGLLANTTGITAESAESLIKMLLPLVMSMLGRQKQSLGLDAAGIRHLLANQRKQIAAELPQPMAVAIGWSAQPAGAAASQPAAAGPTERRGLMKILVPGVLLVVAGWWGFKMFLQPQTDPLANLATEHEIIDLDAMAMPDIDTGDLMPTVDSTTAPAAVPSLDVAQTTELFESYRGVLDHVIDVTTAKAALPKLEELNGQLTGFSETFDKLPAAVRGPLAEPIQSLLPAIKQRLAEVLEIPGVETILRPAIDTMLEKASLFRAG